MLYFFLHMSAFWNKTKSKQKANSTMLQKSPFCSSLLPFSQSFLWSSRLSLIQTMTVRGGKERNWAFRTVVGKNSITELAHGH